MHLLASGTHNGCADEEFVAPPQNNPGSHIGNRDAVASLWKETLFVAVMHHSSRNVGMVGSLLQADCDPGVSTGLAAATAHLWWGRLW